MVTDPLFATPAWRRAVEVADRCCQCTGACGRKHNAGMGACTAEQGVLGVRLNLAEDGRVYCASCFAPIAKAASAAELADAAQVDAEHFAQDSLFAL